MLIFLLLVLPAELALPQTSASNSTQTVTITDMAGRRVTIPKPEYIRRVAIQTSPQVLEAYAIGIQDKLCAVTNAVKMWKTLTRVDPRLADVPATRSGNAQINIEALLQTNPDVCIGGDVDMQVIEATTNLPTLHISQGKPGTYFEQLKKEMAFFGLVFGKGARAKAFNIYLDNLQASIRSGTAALIPGKKLKVFMGYNADHLTTYGANTFMHEWIEAAGCINAAGAVSSLGGKRAGLLPFQWNRSWLGTPISLCSTPEALKNCPPTLCGPSFLQSKAKRFIAYQLAFLSGTGLRAKPVRCCRLGWLSQHIRIASSAWTLRTK